MGKDKVKLAIVGLGYWGPKLVEIFLADEKAEVRVLCDSEWRALSRAVYQHQVTGVSSLERALERDVDALIIATPPQTHAALVRKVLEAGKHVFVEKPLATSYEDAYSLKRLAEEKKLVLFVDHTFCYDEVLLKTRGLMGEVLEGVVYDSRFEWLGARPKPNGPDVLWDSGPHAVSALLFLLGKWPREVSAQVMSRLPNGTAASLQSSLLLQDGTNAKILLAWSGENFDGKPVEKACRILLKGAPADIEYEGSFSRRGVSLIIDGLRTPIGMNLHSEPLKAACRAFLGAIMEKTHILTDGAFGTEVVAILEKIQQAAESGKVLSLRG